MLHALFLNHSYQVIGFITEKRLFKLLAKDKVEVLATWNSTVNWYHSQILQPSIVRLNYESRWIPRNLKFNKTDIFRRDQFVCQYCGDQLASSEATIDHVVPKSKGGKSSWLNCVTSCHSCNNSKGSLSLNEAKLKLLNQPYIPQSKVKSEIQTIPQVHPDWQHYLV